MKRLLVLFTIALILCFAATFIRAQNNSVKEGKTEYSVSQCNLFFSQVLNSKADPNLEIFDDKVEYFLKTGFFWEGCLLKPLQNKQNIILNYIGYTENEQPTKEELHRLLKSAAEFKDELESYIEDHEPKYSPLHWGKKYIVLKAVPGLNLDNNMQKMLKKENKKFKANSDTGKIFIHLQTEQNQQSTGSVIIEANN